MLPPHLDALLTPKVTTHAKMIAPEMQKNFKRFSTKRIGFLGFSTPKYFTSSIPREYIAFNSNFVITSAVNMDKMIPSANVVAKPLTVPDPFTYNTAAAIKVVTLPSTIADNALSKPILIPD